MTDLFGWFLKNFDEITGTIIALAYLYFSIKQNIWLWPLGIISSAIFAYVFFRSKIYAGMGLQIYYVIISIYGWYNWWKVRNGNKLSTTVKSLLGNYKLMVVLLLIVIFLFVVLFQILVHTDTNVPYYDALISALSIVATWMLAKKYIEHWWVWLLADPISIGIFIYQKLYFMVILYFIYSIMAIVGYKSWKKDLAV